MKHYEKDFWNPIEAVSLGLLVIGIVLGNLREIATSERIHQHESETLEGEHTAGRVCFALAITFCFFRLLYFYSVNKRLGPRVLMVQYMVRARDSSALLILKRECECQSLVRKLIILYNYRTCRLIALGADHVLGDHHGIHRWLGYALNTVFEYSVDSTSKAYI